MALTREVQSRGPRIGRAVVLAVIGCVALLLASQQCAANVRTRLDAVIARDPLPRSAR